MTSADQVLPPTDQQTPTAALLQAPEAQALELAIGDMHLLLEQHGYVIAVYSSGIRPEHERRLHSIRSVLESDRIALVKVDLPPLGVAVLVRQLRQLSICDFSPGVVASAARLLSHYIYAGALLNSVARLDRVPVSLKSHAKSWVPGSQFAVLAGPEPQLVKVGPAAEPLAGPEFGTHLLLAKGNLQSDWVQETLAPAWKVQALHDTAVPADSPRWWGTGKLVEFTAYLPDLSVLYQLVSSVRREKCHWCAMELIGDRCAFCSAPLALPENRTAFGGVLHHGADASAGP
ncbi:hypothetical protein RI138_21740 [Streptomyces sp. C11-1]|uniref:Uncharacterized protein n=1 Tax=Streptomyces durocortorensis TaxID=2811104 RepID=A0ABY9W5D8_9ACTN|nr:hypothetical protein [Streptomyces durocortorensis]WNF29237.1 hypothetical protein RI138_21740 [Streptomyces durocortorensis]